MCAFLCMLEHLLSIIETWSYNTVSLAACCLKLLKICLAWLDLDLRAAQMLVKRSRWPHAATCITVLEDAVMAFLQ